MSGIPLCPPASAPASTERRVSVRIPYQQPLWYSQSRSPGNNDDLRASSEMPLPFLREAIQALDSKITTLMSRRQELETRLEQAVRLQSPVLRLPSEILSLIFVMGFTGVEEDAVMVSTLMLVCRFWCKVVLDTPSLWAKISLGPHDSLEKAKRKIERSKSCPLDITVDLGLRMEYTNGITERVCHAMDLIRPVFWRTRSFFLSVHNRPQAHAVLSRCQEDAPLLETLSVRVLHSMQDDTYSSPRLPLFNGHTPRLQSCSFTSFNFAWDRRLVTRLRVLKLGGYFNSFTPSPSTLLGILRECPGLEELALRNMSSVDSDICRSRLEDVQASPLLEPIELVWLRKISFYYSGDALTQQVMSQITYPNLESLEMCYLENITPMLQLLYARTLTQLPLRRLRIETCSFNEAKLLKLLRRLFYLEKLELVDAEDASSGLIRSLSSPFLWICPRLEVLTIDGCTTLDWDSLRTLVESRCSAHDVTLNHTTMPVAPSLDPMASGCSTLAKHDHWTLPQRLRSIDVTRCSQISREMIQWLRMYVAHVKCEPVKGVWGDPMVP